MRASRSVGDVADGVEVGVARLHAGLEMRELGDRAAAEHTDAQAPLASFFTVRPPGIGDEE